MKKILLLTKSRYESITTIPAPDDVMRLSGGGNDRLCLNNDRIHRAGA